eukprot:TRINITY_DN3263_c0_g1_i2.p1 TRINITY_DN3263_c0_g1~~TRINITY_DN3263_c0_g1_i2.p1  ORF type:complete len:615 (+),score=117.05 TRINITY_DN3263_c0_g1_i2:141-1985(+)
MQRQLFLAEGRTRITSLSHAAVFPKSSPTSHCLIRNTRYSQSQISFFTCPSSATVSLRSSGDPSFVYTRLYSVDGTQALGQRHYVTHSAAQGSRGRHSALLPYFCHLRAADNNNQKGTTDNAIVPLDQATKAVVPKKSVGERAREWKVWLVEGAKHYWQGSVLLVKNFKKGIGLIGKVLNGRALTRRERNELITTAADLFRLVPFAVFVIVPFMEFLLPFALKLFPNMLPSTFADKLKKEDDLRRQLKLKLNMAGFLQDTLKEMSKRTDDPTQEFLGFMNSVAAGQTVKPEQLRKYSTIFSDNLSALSAAQQRPLLIATCKFLGLNAYGTNSFLKWQIRMKLNRIKRDDITIAVEGLKVLTFEELRQACADRGMISTGVGKATLKEQISEWLDLSLRATEEELAILLLSRAIVKERKEQEDSKEAEVAVDDHKLLEVADAVSVLSSESALQREREALDKIKQEKKKLEATERQKQRMASIDSAPAEKKAAQEKGKVKETDEEKEKAKENKAKQRLGAKLEAVLSELEEEFEHVEQEVGHKLKFIDKDSDGVVTTQEIADAIELLRTRPSDKEIVDVLRKLDLDQDGKIALRDVEKVLAGAVQAKHQRLANERSS